MPLSPSEAFFNDIKVVVVTLPWQTVIFLYGRGLTSLGGDQYNDVKLNFDTTVATKLNGLPVNLYTTLLVTC